MPIAKSDQKGYRRRIQPGNDEDGNNGQPLARRRRRPVVVRIYKAGCEAGAHRGGVPGLPTEVAGGPGGPGSKTGPGLPPVRPHRREVMQLRFLGCTVLLLTIVLWGRG